MRPFSTSTSKPQWGSHAPILQVVRNIGIAVPPLAAEDNR
jgi:hypothetical protein